jgi:hypothetical protein
MRTIAALAALGLAASGTPAATVPKPPGKAPLRYRDAVFSHVSVRRDVVYGGDQKLDLYMPSGDRTDARPVVVWIHGGGFRTGTKSNRNVVELATAFGQRGYVAASIDYRLLAQGVTCGGTPSPPPQCAGAAVAARDGRGHGKRGHSGRLRDAPGRGPRAVAVPQPLHHALGVLPVRPPGPVAASRSCRCGRASRRTRR